MSKDKEKEAIYEAFAQYLGDLREFAAKEKTEHTDRSALEKLLKAFATHAEGKPKVQHEPLREKGKGAPDFKITRDAMILGYVETKQIGENLGKVLKSHQIEKYKKLSPNIILTDYLEFIWIGKDGAPKREPLCHDTDLDNRKFKLSPERIDAVAALFTGFFSTAPEGIGTSKALAEALAVRSRFLRDYLGEELVRQERDHQEGRLYGLFRTFRDQVFHELTLKEFADAFAQMLAYGLFLARLNADEKTKITLNNAREHIPGSFQLIHELVEFLTELDKDDYVDVRWVVEEVVSIVNGLDLPAIHESLSFRQRKAISRKVRAGDEEEHRLFERDPFIYFYEDYLKAYDKETRKGRGVYYTPPPVVNFIVRAINDILKEKDSFNIKKGLADNKRVTVLDFACGTGTFLLEVFQQIFESVGGADKPIAKKVVSDHILKNIYGFEYLIAPYTIAHLKLSQYLRDKGHALKAKERLQVFLTNTLEPIASEDDQKEMWAVPELAKEVKEAQKIKDKPILVITGNPPYSGHSKNKGEWISAAIDGYKYTIEKDADGREFQKPLGERNPKWLNDDYVKFIRFAQLKMDEVKEGIVGIITNHSWLDNPTFRGMRQSLMRSFEQIYVLDLHGNAKKKERAPDGSKDENVFDIEQGVAISLFVKRAGLERGVWRGDIWGKRLEKYKAAYEGSLKSGNLDFVTPRAPYYLYQIQDDVKRAVYDRGMPLPEIMPLNSVGFVTSRDKLAIGFTDREMTARVSDFSKRDVENAREHYKLGEDVRDWKVSWAQEDVKKGGTVIPVLYRPFDERYTFYTGRSRGFHVYPRETVSRQLLRPNVALITSRLTKGETFRHALVSDKPVEVISLSPITSNNGFVFPLRGDGEAENFSPAFRNFIDSKYENHYSPEELLGYIYSVLHAATYRSVYAEFLRIDFPRVPFPEKASDFEALSKLGWELVQAHLLKDYPDAELAKLNGKGDETVEAARYSEVEKAIWINKTQCFKPVPEDVWKFHIGGYQVLEKYLKSRKGRQLSLDEVNHVGKMADSLAFTITQMAKIDKAYKNAFPDRG